MNKFKIGDRVRGIGKYDGKRIDGKLGTIKQIVGGDYAVEFDEDIGGHTCSGKVKIGHGWWCVERCLELVEANKIVVTTDGKNTIARLYEDKKVIKTVKATCAPDDKFDFALGSMLAIERLLGNPEATLPKKEKLLNTKFCVIEGDEVFETGHIYEVVDGKIDTKHLMYGTVPCGFELHSIEELYDYFKPFIERKLHSGFGWVYNGIKIIEVIDD